MSKARILVVEDEVIVARDIARQLTELGYEPVAEAGRGEEAIELVERLRPDLVLMDIQLAGAMDGIEAAQVIRGRLSIPVVFLTAFTGAPTVQRAKTAEPFGYLVKPFDPQQLATAVEMARHQHSVVMRLRASREELATILRTAMDGFWIVDRQGKFLEVNDTYCQLTGYTRAELLELTVSALEADKNKEEIEQHLAQISHQSSSRFERRHRVKDGRLIDFEISVNFRPDSDGRFFCFLHDITERKRADHERDATVKLLHLINDQNDLHELLRVATALLHEWSGCDAVGIRLREEDDYPYFETSGFPQHFVELERHLCHRDATGNLVRDAAGNPVLECMCGAILCGRTDTTKPFFTAHGSFWTNCTTQLLASTTEADRQARTRNRCNGEGYESVALIPLRVGATTYGLLQFNDKRRDRFTPERIALLERVANSLAVAIAQRQAQADLRASEARFRQLLESTTDYVVSVEHRADGLVQTRHGPGCLKVTGYTAEEFAQRPRLWLEMVPQEDRDRVEAYAKRITAGEQSPPLEHRITHRDGSIRWVRNSTVLCRSASGKPQIHEGVITDITARKQAELALRESEQRHRTLFESSLQGVVYHDAAGKITRANPAALRLLESSLEQIQGLAPQDPHWQTVREDGTAFPGDEHPAMIALRTGKPVRGVVMGILAAGGKAARWILVDAIPELQPGAAAPHRVFAMFADITERKQAEAALRASEAKFAIAFRAGPVMSAITTLDNGTYLDVSNGFLRGMGYAREEVIGLTSAALSGMAPADRAHLLELIRHDGHVNALPLTVTGNRGRKLDCLFNTELVEIDGRACLLNVAIDVTEQRRLEAQLRQAQKMEAIGQLAGGVAHDFNNLLAAIALHLGLLREAPGIDAETRTALRDLETETARGAGLTRQLLAFSRQQAMEIRPVNLNEIIENLLKMLRRVLGERITVEWKSQPSLATVEADAGMLEQIVVNLCVNARDAMPSGGRLLLTTDTVTIDESYAKTNLSARPGRFVRLSISDTGSGMDSTTLGRIFEPFFTTKEVGQGTGLGLAIVHGIVKQHSGWVEVESAVGLGTTFRVLLPAKQLLVQTAAPAGQDTLAHGHNELLLVVEDEVSVRTVLAISLRRYGYRVQLASDGREALELWQAHHSEIALVLTDMVLPGCMTGTELIERFRADRPELPVILASGYMRTKEGITIPNVSTLPKPFEMHTLLTTLRSCLDSPRPNPTAN